ncbi:hypothetical protein EU527_02495 [Candidatus Thorarchaeota archaeon]|nr:MAG: hypothetical protein EU527_02495 [Candidatus Thorarchaeota archaeon]
MHLSEQRSGILIPEGVNPKDIIESLTIGHGYKWIILTEQPILVAYGEPSVGDMPELLLTGDKSIVVAGSNSAYVSRIRSVLEMLQRQAHRINFSKEV